MAKYSQQQIDAVRKLQALHGVSGTLRDEDCEKYLEWHLSTQTASARGVTSVEQARAIGLSQGLSHHEQQFRMLSALAR